MQPAGQPGMLTLRSETYRKIAAFMHEAIGIAFSDSKLHLVSARLGPRIQRLGLTGFEDYLRLIAHGEDAGEFQVAVDLLTTNETYFFREADHFRFLERDITGTKPRSLAVWSAASSFGDEAYSTAMLLADLQRRGYLGEDWSILGTDISDRVLRSAIDAVYPLDRLRHVTQEQRKRHCLRGEGESDGLVRIHPQLCQRVRFGRLNLCQPFEDLGPFDVIFLRNVLIYFDADTKRAVMDRVLTQLRTGGLFFIGMAEGRARCDTPLQMLQPGVFRKSAGSRP